MVDQGQDQHGDRTRAYNKCPDLMGRGIPTVCVVGVEPVEGFEPPA